MDFIQKLNDKCPLLLVALPYIGGILLADSLGHSDSLPKIACVGLVACIFLFVLSQQLKKRLTEQLKLASLGLGFVFLGILAWSLHHPTSQNQWPEGKTMWRGIVEDSRARGKTERVVVWLHSCSVERTWQRTTGKAELILLKDSSLQRICRPGDALLFYGHVAAVEGTKNNNGFNYADYLRRRGIRGQATIFRLWRKQSDTASNRMLKELPFHARWRIGCLKLRSRCIEQYRHYTLSDRQLQVLEALTLGEKYDLTRPIRELYSQVGAAHVLALSGLHLGILVFFLLFLLRPFQEKRTGRVLTVLLTLLLIWGFTFLTGMSVSLVRAALMYSAMTLLLLQERKGGSLNRIALAAVLILTLSPDSLFDISFQLSFLSVLFIVGCWPWYASCRPQNRILCWATDFCYVAILAQLGTAPLIAHTFHQLTPWFLLSNLIVVPATYVILLLSLLFFCFSGIISFQSFFIFIIGVVVNFMNEGLQSIANLPYSSIQINLNGPFTCAAYLLIAIVLWMIKPRWRN